MAPENTTTDLVEEEQEGTSGSTGLLDPVVEFLKCAAGEIGYTEKNDVAYIDDAVKDTTHAGSGNCTKYARDLSGSNTEEFNNKYGIETGVGIYYGNKQRVAWCAMFVDWCFVMVFGYEAMKNMTFHGQDGAGVSNSRSHYEANGRFITSDPQPGDEVFFDGHTGLVWKIEGDYVITIEGNTSGKEGVVSEGGCVCDKKYSIGSSSIIGYGRPDWSKAPETFLYTGGAGEAFGVDYINAYITSCTRDTLSVNISSASPLNKDSITATLYKGAVTVTSAPANNPDYTPPTLTETDEDSIDDNGNFNSASVAPGNVVLSEKIPYDNTPLTVKGLYNKGKLAKIEIDISELPPNELVTLELSASSNSSSHKTGLGFTTPQEYPKQVQNVKITALRYSYNTVFDTDYLVYFSRLPWKTSGSDWGYWKDEKDWDTGYTVYLIKNREIYKELFNFVYTESRGGTPSNLPENLHYSQDNFSFNLNQVLSQYGIKNLRELGIGSNIQIGIRTWVYGKYTSDDNKVKLSLPELPKGSNTLQLDYKTNVTNRCYFNINGKYARLSLYKK